MTKIPRPHGFVTSQRAAGSEELLPGASNSPDTKEQDGEQARIAWAHIFVTRYGDIGYWIPVCPFCGFEHAHGGYAPFDPRKTHGWRASHCFQAPRKCWGSFREGTYELRFARGPTRFAPGAARLPRAQRTMSYWAAARRALY
jgi:hypothetical protein